MKASTIRAFLLSLVAMAIVASSAAAQTTCAPAAGARQLVYVTALNSRLFFSDPTQVDSPVANPQVLTSLLRPSLDDPDKVVFGVTLIDYTRGAKVYDADQIAGRFEVQVFPPSSIARSSANTIVAQPTGATFQEFVHNRQDLSGRVAKLLRVEIPTASLFRHLPTVDGEPGLALGTVMALLRDADDDVIACSYMSPLTRHLASNQAAATAVTASPHPFVIAAAASVPKATEVVHVEPMNVTTKVGATRYEIGLMANPPAIEGVATSPTNGGASFDFALTYVRFDGKGGTHRVFTDGDCKAPLNQYGVRGIASGPGYPPGTQLKLRIRPVGVDTPTGTTDLEVEWNGADAVILPLHDTASVGGTRFYCVARIQVPACDIQRALGPLPGLDRSVRIGLVEGLHVASEDGVEVVRSGFFNRQNRFVAARKELSEASAAVAQPVVFLVDPEPFCQPS